MHNQRLYIVIPAAIGMLATFMPWVNAPFIGSVSGSAGDGWFTFVFFGAIVLLSLLGDRKAELVRSHKVGIVALGFLAVMFGAWKIFAIKTSMQSLKDNPFAVALQNSISVGFGLYIVILAASAIIFFVLRGEIIKNNNLLTGPFWKNISPRVISAALMVVTFLVAGILSWRSIPSKTPVLKRGEDSAVSNQSVPVENNQSSKIDLEILKKGFDDVDIMNGVYQSQITMELKFTNKTDKDIRGIEGILTFWDIFDNEIKKSRLSIDDGIPKNGILNWSAVMDYNEFLDDSIKLKNTELKNLKYHWSLTTIIYDDGTKETF